MQETTLFPQLAHGPWKKRFRAVDELAGHHDDEVVAALVKALVVRSFWVRWSILEALGAIGSPKATAEVVRILDDWGVRVAKSDDLAAS